MPRMKIRPQQSRSRARAMAAIIRVGSNRDQPFCSVQFDRLSAEQAFGVCLHGVDDISGERTVLRPTREQNPVGLHCTRRRYRRLGSICSTLKAIQRPFVGGKIQDF